VSTANGMRAVPDLAMSAAAHDGYIIFENGNEYVIAGTSAASPSFAGVMALIVQSKAGKGQGNANPVLYGLLSASKSPFHATPSGNNSVPGVAGFTAAGAAYNLATGLGSVDAAALLNAWGSGSTTKPSVDFSLTPSATSGTAAAGKSVTFSLTVTETGNAKNPVTFSATAPNGVSGSISPASVLPGTNATVTVTSASSMSPGAKPIAITATDSTGSQTATYTLTVTAPPSLTLSVLPASIVLTQGVAGTASLSAVTGGAFLGTISYSLSGLPSGVSAKWSANPQTASASGSANSETLTLSASTAPAAASLATVVVTAAGDGVASSKSFLLQVQPAPAKKLNAGPSPASLRQQ
jgi:subtilase family serine protease